MICPICQNSWDIRKIFNWVYVVRWFQAPKSITTFRNVYCLQKAAWHNEMSHCHIVNSYLCIQIQFERKFSSIIDIDIQFKLENS